MLSMLVFRPCSCQNAVQLHVQPSSSLKMYDGVQIERLASRMLRVQEKHRDKLRQQAAQYKQAAGHCLSSHACRNASVAALSSIRARVEVVRCLKELHKSELRIEMCTDDVVSLNTLHLHVAFQQPMLAMTYRLECHSPSLETQIAVAGAVACVADF